jgi:acyl-CoA reductase-like NAD-dependent aldehyde dehydrogenase
MHPIDRAVCFTVHGLPHLRAALKAGVEAGRPIVAISAVAASAYAGALWFAEMIQAGREEFPDAKLTAILDCGDRAGDVLVALEAGIACVIFTGNPDAARRLTAIAAETGAAILAERPASFDLLNLRDPDFAARRRCADAN